MFARTLATIAMVAAASSSLATAEVASAGAVYGLGLVANAPARFALLTANATTGEFTLVGKGTPHTQLAGMSDLCEVDTKRGVYYYLGDTSDGATLVGLNLKDGELTCTSPIAVREVGFVGIGQSLNYDTVNDALIISGIVGSTTPTHHVFKLQLGGGVSTSCGAITSIGSFGEAESLPMLHGSALDAKGQRLFIGLSPGKGAVELGVFDLATATLGKIVTESGVQDLVGMSYNPRANTLVGVGSKDGGYDGSSLRALNLTDGTWRVTPFPARFGAAGANDGQVTAFDADNGVLYCLLYSGPPTKSGNPPLDLVEVDVNTGSIISHVPTGKIGMCDAECLTQLAFAPASARQL